MSTAYAGTGSLLHLRLVRLTGIGEMPRGQCFLKRAKYTASERYYLPSQPFRRRILDELCGIALAFFVELCIMEAGELVTYVSYNADDKEENYAHTEPCTK